MELMKQSQDSISFRSIYYQWETRLSSFIKIFQRNETLVPVSSVTNKNDTLYQKVFITITFAGCLDDTKVIFLRRQTQHVIYCLLHTMVRNTESDI